MNYLAFTLMFIFLVYVVTQVRCKKDDFLFLSPTHTQVAKGIGILLVVLSHMGHMFHIRYLAPLGGTGVAIFLMISAYGLSESYKKKGLSNFWTKRVTKILIPYFIVQTVYTAFFSQHQMGIYLYDIFLISPRHPFSWYLEIIITWYVLFYLVYKIDYLRNHKRIIFLAISLGFLFLPNELWAEQSFSFFLGLIASEKFENKLSRVKGITIVSLILVGIVFLFVKQTSFVQILPKQVLYWMQLVYKTLYAIGSILLVYKIRKAYKMYFFIFIGTISYEIYLVHGYTIRLLDRMSYENICIFLFLTVAISWLLNVISTRIFCYQKQFSKE